MDKPLSQDHHTVSQNGNTVALCPSPGMDNMEHKGAGL
jgi:hypothetical protein